MDLTKTIINKYGQIKESLKEAIFSKNKSIIHISDFSKKSMIKKILIFTSVNLFVLIPYVFWFATASKFAFSIPLIIVSFTSVLLLSNTLFFTSAKIISSLINLFSNNKAKKEITPVLINPQASQDVVLETEYFEKGFIGKIKEFFVATASVATSFLPFILFTNLLLFSYFLQSYNLFRIDMSFFSNPLNYLRIDSVILLFLTTLTTGSIYGLKLISFLKKVFIKALIAKKETDNTSKDLKSNAQDYKSQRGFPIEEFIPSLSKEFKKDNGINAYEEMKATQEFKKN